MSEILIVDDDDDHRVVLAMALIEAGYSVIQAYDGIVGLEKVKTQLPDLIICDINMPNLSGFEFIEALKEIPDAGRIPFIFLTGYTRPMDIRTGMELGADDYLAKPVSIDDLLRAVQARLSKKEQWQKHVEEKMESLRKSFRTMLPHELKTPLNSIIGATELLKEELDTLEKEDVGKLAEIICKSAYRLDRSIENFLLYAQMESVLLDGKSELKLRSGTTPSIRSLIESATKRIIEFYDRENDYIFDIQDTSVDVTEEYLRKIVEEVIDNGFKFSNPGSKVKIEVKIDSDDVAFVVHDSGRGMTSEQINGISAFVQFERKIYEQQGSGLGLTIAKKLAEAHKGSLSIDSDPGKGTSIMVRLPRKAESV